MGVRVEAIADVGASPESRPRLIMTARAVARASRRLWLHKQLLVGGGLLALVALAALLAPLLAPVDPHLVRPSLRLAPPGSAALFGTDPFGRDLFSQVLFGARLALVVSLVSVSLAAAPGMALGLIAGYHGGPLDYVLSRLMEAWLSIPGMLLAIVLVARLGPSLNTVMFAVGVMGVPTYFRLLRSNAMIGVGMPYVESARCTGATDARIILRHILPNASSPVIVLTTLRLGTALLAAGGLSFLGLGAQPPTPEWGALLATGRQYLETAWWLAFFPGAAITVTVLGFNLLGDGLRDLLARDMQRGQGR